MKDLRVDCRLFTAVKTTLKRHATQWVQDVELLITMKIRHHFNVSLYNVVVWPLSKFLFSSADIEMKK